MQLLRCCLSYVNVFQNFTILFPYISPINDMTEDAVEVCSMLNSQFAEATSEASTVAQLDNTLYLNSNIAVDGSCLFTTTDLAGGFPEGTVLQILPDSTILAVPPLKEASNQNLNNTIIFKDPSFISDLSGSQTNTQVSNLLAEPDNQNGLANVPICSEANMSDLDLSFLSETVDSISTPTSKALNDAALKELQGSIAPQSLDVVEGDPCNNESVNGGISDSLSSPPKDTDEPAEDVVMIDVSKPIQLSQNSLIMVNGQKCVLQQTQSGQVVAYPVKEQEKPRRRRGRPRKTSVEQAPNDTSLEASPELDNASDDDKEHGLLEIVNDDGSLVRRSTRRRRKNKVLKDYETGNLKQELGSDVEESELVEVDGEMSRRKKAKGPGRPRKNPIPEPIVSGMKRQRGRPKKPVIENEPTQAFLVQTDGQLLMMQVPLSSIPPGVSLEEVAQNIANRLSVGLGHTQTNAATELRNILPAKSQSTQDPESLSEPAVQDHSVGSTTNLCNIEGFKNMETLENNCGSSSENLSPDVTDSAKASEILDAALNSIPERNVSDSNISSFFSENILTTKPQFSNLQIPQENALLNIPTSISSTTGMSLTCDKTESEEQDLEANFTQFQVPKDFLLSADFMKGKMNLQDLLENVVSNAEEPRIMPEGNASNKEGDSLHPQEDYSTLNAENDLKDFEANLDAGITSRGKDIEQKQEASAEAPNHDKMELVDNSYDFLTSDLSHSIICANTAKTMVPNEAIISSIKHDHNLLVQSVPAAEDKASSKNIGKSNVLKTQISVSKKGFQPILPVQKTVSNLETSTNVGTILSIPAMAVVPVSSDQQLQLSDKILPVILPAELPGSIKCKICQRCYFSDQELIKHFKSQHPKCICKECNYMSEYSYMMKRHAVRHTERGVVCEECGKHYKDHYILKMHIKMVHSIAEVLYTCDICEKKFTRKAHLKRHLRIHQPDRPYKCSFCNYRGCEKSDITKHILIHEAPKHACHICGKAFRHIKNKELHLKRHFKQRDYKCGICNFYGYTFTDIRKHIERRHTDAKSSTCLSCGLVFKSKEMLEEHFASGQCEIPLGEDQNIKQESVEMVETSALEDMSSDLLETDQNREEHNPIENDSQYKTCTLQQGQFIMNSDGILSTSNSQILVNGLEGAEFLSSENLPFLNVGNESSKLITLVTNDGKNYTLPPKESGSTSESSDCSLTLNTNNKVETLFLSALQEDENT
ncbi:hypothetical protein JTE90_027620 [Oedothorax gibbosus]|uniref:C2H2-type domain-containing protein n=1 Tax=Oedothorax gibbosus TaxID=931172 RepID=A0AAV6VN00_9ARAC|nr:hypothetical protein JTE90_027620 [Oedothorax gibbosus]